MTDVLDGANLFAIGDGTQDGWEILQFCDAELVGNKTYAVRRLIRGKFGTEVEHIWPAGSLLVALDRSVEQLNLSVASRTLERDFLVGPAARPYSDHAYVHHNLAFSGNGLRPFAPAHLEARRTEENSISISWVRRTRIDGDNWAAWDVPLGEESELYLVRISQGSAIVREAICSEAHFVYSAAMQSADGDPSALTIEVAQVSASYGPGRFKRIDVNV